MIDNFFSNQPSLEFQSSNYQKLRYTYVFFPNVIVILSECLK